MELKLTGKYVKEYEKYSDKIIDYFCQGLLCNEISAKLKEDCGINIPYQAITIFYKNNKEYIHECQKTKKAEKLDDVIRNKGLEYAKQIIYAYLLEADKTLIKDVESLPPDVRIKLIPTMANALAKLDGLDKSEINFNNGPNFEDFFDEEIIEDAINDFRSSDERSD